MRGLMSGWLLIYLLVLAVTSVNMFSYLAEFPREEATNDQMTLPQCNKPRVPQTTTHVSFVLQFGQIDTKWDKSGTF